MALITRLLGGSIGASRRLYMSLETYHNNFQRDPLYRQMLEESPGIYDQLLMRHAANKNSFWVNTSSFCTVVCLAGVAYGCKTDDVIMVAVYTALTAGNGWCLYDRGSVLSELRVVERELFKKEDKKE